jgi:hypothetical protein
MKVSSQDNPQWKCQCMMVMMAQIKNSDLYQLGECTWKIQRK